MKYFIIAICLVGVVIADKKGDQFDNDPKCVNFDKINAKANSTTCCKSLPKVFNKASYQKCETDCDGKGYCCKANCVLKNSNVTDATGKLDVVKAKEFLKNAVAGANYPTDKIIDDCVALAPKAVEEWKKNHANKTEKADKKDKSKADKAAKLTCENPENTHITKCIRRELILMCPDWNPSAECKDLLDFATTCTKYPPRCHGGKKGEGKKGDEKKKAKQEKSA